MAEPGSSPQGGTGPTTGSGEKCSGASRERRGRPGPCAPARLTRTSTRTRAKAPARLQEPRSCCPACGKRHRGHEQCAHPRGRRCQEPPGNRAGSAGSGCARPFQPGSHPASPRFPPVPPGPPPAQPRAGGAEVDAAPGRGATPGAAGGAPGGRGEAPRCPGQQQGAAGRAPRSPEPPGAAPAGGPRCPPASPVPPPRPGSRRRNEPKAAAGKTKAKVPGPRLRFRLPGALPRAPRGRGGRGARWRSRGRRCG